MSDDVFVSRLPADHPPRVSHREAAHRMRANPRRWRLIGTSATRDAARNAACRIRNGMRPAYTPAGAFQAVAITTESGVHQVWARYVGGER